MLANLKAFGSSLMKHWALTIVLVVVVALFAAGTIKSLAAKVPFLSKYAGA